MINDYNREVDYEKYCKTCKYLGIDECEEPCDSCLDEPFNEGTDRPVKWEENKK